MKKIFFLILAGSLFFPFTILAIGGSYQVIDSFPVKECGDPGPLNYTVRYKGLVPCGECLDVDPAQFARAWWDGECEQKTALGDPVVQCQPLFKKFIPCTTCHFFVMIDGIIDFVLLKVVPPVATLILIFGGVAFYQAGANPEKLSWAKKFLLGAIIGLIIIYLSWIIVNEVLNAVGVADWVGFGEGWFRINCEVELKGILIKE